MIIGFRTLPGSCHGLSQGESHTHPGASSRQEKSHEFRERPQALLVLDALRNSITEENPRVSAISALFAAHAMNLALRPEHELYPMINKYLLQKPVLDLTVRFPVLLSVSSRSAISWRVVGGAGGAPVFPAVQQRLHARAARSQVDAFAGRQQPRFLRGTPPHLTGDRRSRGVFVLTHEPSCV